MLHRFRLVLIAAAIAPAVVSSAAAQDVPDRASAVEYRAQFLKDLDTLNSKVMALANAIPADKYDWRPGPGVRSFGEVFMHLASEYWLYTPVSFGAPRPGDFPRGQDGMKKFEANSSKDSVLKYLKGGYDYARSSLMALDPAKLAGTQKIFGRDFTVLETGIAMTADMHEHLGQLIAYSRMNGIVPPWSR